MNLTLNDQHSFIFIRVGKDRVQFGILLIRKKFTEEMILNKYFLGKEKTTHI